ncbi:MAG: phosphatase [Bacteroidetes bacterium]|nr:phosphatase [Bacteroidota bacterium]
MRLAVIDCGTNTFNLLIVAFDSQKKYSKVFNSRIAVKLGQGSINEGFIADEPFKRGIDAMKVLNQEISKYNVSKILAFATSAIRDAENGKQFVEEVKRQTNIDVEIINGDREAELIYIGNKAAVELKDSVSLIMDIGGGSNEFILANSKGLLWKQSFPIGAARMLDKFSPSDPITIKEIADIKEFLKVQLAPLIEAAKEFLPMELIGSSGAFDSIVEIINGELNGEPIVESKTCYDIKMADYLYVSKLIKHSTLDERKKIKGLVAMRFDMIVISCLMIDVVIKAFNIPQMRVSTFSLKEGALIDHIIQVGKIK